MLITPLHDTEPVICMYSTYVLQCPDTTCTVCRPRIKYVPIHRTSTSFFNAVMLRGEGLTEENASKTS